MGKRIVAVNAGPRKGWNTDSLISEAIRGAEARGATVTRFDLFRLERDRERDRARRKDKAAKAEAVA